MTTILRGGRVVDPGSMRDEVADVVIEGRSITAVGQDIPAPAGAVEVDVRGLVVGPGFVDLHSHVHGIAGQRLQALDGVTTALDLELGLMPIVDGYAKAAQEGRPLNYGFSASWAAARGRVLAGVEPIADFRQYSALGADPEWRRSSTPRELGAWLDLLGEELAAGALGIGVALGYAPQSDPAEFVQVAKLAAKAGVPTFTHVRELIEVDPTTPIDGSAEIVQAAAASGAHMHHCHVNSTSRRHIDRVLQTLGDAVAEGSSVTLEAYPYGAGNTAVGVAFLAPEHLKMWGLRPSNLVLLPSGERIADERRLREVREKEPGTMCIVEFLDERSPADMALVKRSLAYPDSIVASDAVPVILPDGAADTREWPLPAGSMAHPRTSGSFAKSLRLMVRETGTWTWLEAFRRCSWLPARILDSMAPDARAKGHLGVGADADIVVIDPEGIWDTATYLDPTSPSVGVVHSFVGGESVVRDRELVTDAYPGRALRGQPK